MGSRSAVNQSGRDVDGLVPAGTVTLLAAKVEDSSRPREAEPDQMSAVARLDDAVWDIVAAHHGMRPVDGSERDSFVLRLRTSDAWHARFCHGCALRSPMAALCTPAEYKQLDDGFCSPMNRTARLRDLAHDGQIVLSGTTHDVAADRLPADVWLMDLGRHRLPDLSRPERVMQVCHPDLCNEFPPLQTLNVCAEERFSAELTSFVGREAEIGEVRRILAHNRLVTLTGTGGAGKTRLAVQVAAQLAGEFCDGVSWVDLAPVTDPHLVPVTVARTLGAPDQPGRSMLDILTGFIGDRRVLLVLDNLEHLLDSCAPRIAALLGACPGLTMLATSREPIGVPGEVTWRVPSLSLADEAIELFTDRARRVRPDFALSDDNTAAVREICRRLDGIPLAIELAAARVRALSLNDILDGLQDRFQLLTGGGRTGVHRHQTLRASEDWSHELLSESERILFRRLAVFLGGFDLKAAQAVGATGALDRDQVLEHVTMLVDKSLAIAETHGPRMRYRLLETVRVYALEKLGESGEENAVRARHRDHYTSLAAELDSPAPAGHEQLLELAEIEIDNLRAAFAFSRDNCDHDLALQLASSLQSLWLIRGRVSEGLAWFDGILDHPGVQQGELAPAVRARALADRAVLDASRAIREKTDQVQQALAIAREVGDPALLVRALIARGSIASHDVDGVRPYFAEAMEIARALGDGFTLCQILAWQAFAAHAAGDAGATRAAGEEGRDLADAIGARLHSRQCRWCLGSAHMMNGDVRTAIAELREVTDEADAAHDFLFRWCGRVNLSHALACHGEADQARSTAEAAVEAAAQFGGYSEGYGYAALATAALAAGDVAAAAEASAAARKRLGARQELALYDINSLAQVALAHGDFTAAREWADIAVSAMSGGTWRRRWPHARASRSLRGTRRWPNATPVRGSRAPRRCRRCWPSPTSSNASPGWPPMPAVCGRRRECSVRRRRSATARASCASRFTTRDTNAGWRRCEMRWSATS